MLNLCLAVVWLVIGGVMLFLFYFTDDPQYQVFIPRTQIPAGWVGMVLTVYNLLRWWMQWTKRDTGEFERVHEHQKDLRSRWSTREEEPPNPAFDFTDKPPPAKPPELTDRPPSVN